jgi:4'-phosphopantetheinyl transferase
MNQANSIDLWLSYYDTAVDEAAYLALLSAEEKAQQLRFRFADDRKRYLVTRALVRTVLSRYLPLSADAWQFANNRFGRPEIANRVAGADRLTFNLSHTRGVIALAIAWHSAVGVDVENVPERNMTDIADRFFAAEEVAALRSLPEHQQQQRFFEFWTLKEAYIKARGMGLAIPLDKFHFRFADRRSLALVVHPELADDASRWQFWQLQLSPQQLLALCAERRMPSPRLTVRKITPLADEQTLVADVLRTSD